MADQANDKTPGEAVAPEVSDGQGKTEFANALEVTEYLQAEGWKVKKSTLYAHVKQGKLRPDGAGKFSIKAVLRYASSFLQLESTRQKRQDEDLQRKRISAEIARIDEQTKRERIKRMREEGSLVPREQVDLIEASICGIFDTTTKNNIQTLAAERIALVGGDPAKVPDLIAFDMTRHEDTMNQIATTREFRMTFEKTSTEEEKIDE